MEYRGKRREGGEGEGEREREKERTRRDSRGREMCACTRKKSHSVSFHAMGDVWAQNL